MFATTVLLLSMLSAVTSQLAAISLVRTARENNTATAELIAAMEHITGEQFDEIATLHPGGAAMPDYTDRALRDERMVPTYPGGIGDPLTIVMTLTWTDWGGRAARMRASTLRVQ